MVITVKYSSENVYIDYDYRGELGPDPTYVHHTKSSVHLFRAVRPELAHHGMKLCECLRCEVKRSRQKGGRQRQ